MVGHDTYFNQYKVLSGEIHLQHMFCNMYRHLGQYILLMCTQNNSSIGIKSLKKTLAFLVDVWRRWLDYFCRATKWAVRNVKHIQDHFCKASGQLVNSTSLNSTFKGMNNPDKKEISDVLQISWSNTKCSYLGCSNINNKEAK